MLWDYIQRSRWNLLNNAIQKLGFVGNYQIYV